MLERVRGMIRGEVPPPPVAELLGFRILDVEPGRAVFAMDAGPQHANPMGTLHGGILCDLADAAMGIAYASTLAEGESFTTLELKINFFKPVWTARLTATARIVKRGRTIGHGGMRRRRRDGQPRRARVEHVHDARRKDGRGPLAPDSGPLRYRPFGRSARTSPSYRESSSVAASHARGRSASSES